MDDNKYGIYNEKFINFIIKYSNDNVKIRRNNIVIPCPYCEFGEIKKHYHCYISKEIPMFHCFNSICLKKSGNLSNLIRKINGLDISDNFINYNKINKNNNIKFTEQKKYKNKKVDICIPELRTDNFKLKSLYIKKRLGFNIDIRTINGMFFDINKFFNLNKDKIKFNESFYKIKDYLHTNFIGFITENKSVAFFRNINNSQFKHFKIKMFNTDFSDSYIIYGNDYYSNNVVLAEGIFDIWNEYIFDTLKLKNKTKLYSSILSSDYKSLIKSIVFYKKIYRLNISVLSDSDVNLKYYENLKKYNEHIINTLTVYYNKNGKDFGDFPIFPEKIII